MVNLVRRFQVLGEVNFGEIWAASRQDALNIFKEKSGESDAIAFEFGKAPKILTLKEIRQIESENSDLSEERIYLLIKLMDNRIFDKEDELDRWEVIHELPSNE